MALQRLQLTANATAWDDYDLQTDHYVFAFLISGVYYNPLYYGEGSCNDDSGDCSVGSGGGITYYVTVEELYLGSTVADQMNVPQNGSVPTFPDNLYNNFLASSGLPNPGPVSFKINALAWFAKLAAFGAAIDLTATAEASGSPVPFVVDLEKPPRGDEYAPYQGTISGTARFRGYILKDTLGRPWSTSNAVIVAERFSDPIGGALPGANGIWYSAVKNPSQSFGEPISSSPPGEMVDHYGLSGSPVGFLQYYYAYSFSAPSWLKLPGFSLPGLPGSLPGGTPLGLVVPLWIHDAYNSCEASLGGALTALPAQAIFLNTPYIGVDGDKGPPPAAGCAPIL